MVTKGIITSIDFGGNTCKVRVPFFETAGNDPIIGNAIISNTPGMYNGYKVDDVVLVAFEDGQMDNPVVIGKLYLGAEKEKADPRGSLNTESLTASKTATVPADTKLTTNTDKNLPNTMNPYANLSSIANNLNKLNTDVNYLDAFVGNQFRSVITDADGMQSAIEQNAWDIKNTVLHKKDDGSQHGFGWDLTNEYWKIKAYDQTSGGTLPANGLDIFTITRDTVEINAPNVKLTGQPKESKTVYLSILKTAADPTSSTTGWQDTIPASDADCNIWSATQTVYYAYTEDNDGSGTWNTRTEISNIKNLANIDAHEAAAAAQQAADDADDRITNEVSPAVTALEQGKSTNYYSSEDPATVWKDPSDHSKGYKYVIKSGDCWFSLDEYGEYEEVSYSPPADTKTVRTPPVRLSDPLYEYDDEDFVKEIPLGLHGDRSLSDVIGSVRNHVFDNYIMTASDAIAENTASVLSDGSQYEDALFEDPTGVMEYVLPSAGDIQSIVESFIWEQINSDWAEIEGNMLRYDAGGDEWILTVFGPYDLYAFDEAGCEAALLAELKNGPIADLVELGYYYYKQNGSYVEITTENGAGLLSFTTSVTKRESGAYTGYCEGALNFNGIETGVTLYKQSKKAAGDLKQWVGNPSNDDNPGDWEDIGGELVVNKVTAEYVNALDITAKKITVLQDAASTSSPILFEADGLSNPPSVQIAGFEVDSTALTAGTPGSASSVLVSTGYSIQGTSSTASNNFMGFSSYELSNKQWALTADVNFGLDTSGNVYAKNFYITNTDNTNRLRISTEKANMQIAERIIITPGGISNSDVTVRKIEAAAYDDEYRVGEYKVTLNDLHISAITENDNNLTAAKTVYAKVSFVLYGTKKNPSGPYFPPSIPMSGTVTITIAAGSHINSTAQDFHGHGGTVAITASEYNWEVREFRYTITDSRGNELSTDAYGDVTLSRDTFYMYGDILPSVTRSYVLGAPNKKWQDIFSDYAHVSSLQADNIGADRLVASAISADKIDAKTVKIRTENNDSNYNYANLYYVAVAVPAANSNSTATTDIKTDNTVQGAFCYVPGSGSGGVPYNFYITMTYSGKTITLTNNGLNAGTTACIFYIA